MALIVGSCEAATLQVSSVNATPGSTVPVYLTLASPTGASPAALQWDLTNVPGITGVTTTLSAGLSGVKSLQCSGARCLVSGMNSNTMPNGLLATLNVTLSPAASGNILVQLGNLSAAAADGNSLPISTQPGSISVVTQIAVSLSPAAATLAANQTQQFTAAVTGGSGNTAVTWSVSPNVGTVSTTGLYTAPATISAQQTVTVTATSVADGTKAASAAVTLVTAVNVTVNPAAATLAANQTQQFTADGDRRLRQHGGDVECEPECGDGEHHGVIHGPGDHQRAADGDGDSDQRSGRDQGGERGGDAGNGGQRDGEPGGGDAGGESDAAVHGRGDRRLRQHGGDVECEPECGDGEHHGVIHGPGDHRRAADGDGDSDQRSGRNEDCERGGDVDNAGQRDGKPGGGDAGGESDTAVHGGGDWRLRQHGGDVDGEPECGDGERDGLIHGAGEHQRAADGDGHSDERSGRDEDGERGGDADNAAECDSQPGGGDAGGESDAAVHGHGDRRLRQYGSDVECEPGGRDVSTTGLYTAPATISAQQTVTVTATSVADGTKAASAAVTLITAVNVTVNPAAATLAANQTQQFTAAVTGGSGNTAVTWTVSPNVGTVSTTGLYTAPATIGAQQTVTVTATSVADGTKTRARR